MTPKIERFIAEHVSDDPYLVVDLDVVEANYQSLRDALPLAEIYYAVKANPAAPVLDRLTGLGSKFDAASLAEVEQCLAAGAKPEDISYGNTIKKMGDIKRAYDLGIRLFAFDAAEELDKLIQNAPGASVYCRITTENGGAKWPLSRKFGCDLDMARDLMLLARSAGLYPIGLSFHVGSQQTAPDQWDIAIARAAMIFTDLRERGLDLRMLNLGGGYPAKYRDTVPELADYGDAIMASMTKHFGNNLPEMLIEPGRAIVAEAGVIEAEVVLVSKKSETDDRRWVYLDVGKFGGLAETMDEAITYTIRTPHDGSPVGPVAVAGPTCDGADILYERAGYELPLALKSGDRVMIEAAGAYTTTYASIGFNGFKPLGEYYL